MWRAVEEILDLDLHPVIDLTTVVFHRTNDRSDDYHDDYEEEYYDVEAEYYYYDDGDDGYGIIDMVADFFFD